MNTPDDRVDDGLRGPQDCSTATWRQATPAENMEVLYARLHDQMSPAERRELQEVIGILRSATRPNEDH